MVTGLQYWLSRARASPRMESLPGIGYHRLPFDGEGRLTVPSKRRFQPARMVDGCAVMLR